MTAPPVVTRPVGRVRTSPGWRDAIGVLTWTSLLVVVALWVGDGELRAFTGWTSALNSLGRLTGLVAADLLLIQVLLMARIPVVERVYGQDVLARRHRLVGFTSLNLMLAHVLLITIGYAGLDSKNVLVEAWDLVVQYPGMLLALVATGLLLMVAVTSVRKARRRLRYESWHLLHLYAYLGAGLALPHQLWTGQEFLTHRAATLYWWSLWIAAAGAVLVYRVGLPVYRTLRHDLRVTHVVQERPGVVSVWMAGRDLHRLPVAAGRFFTWRFLAGPGWTRGHPYSLSAAPTGTTLRITVKDLGDGSRAVARLRPGCRVLFEGPYGRLHSGVRTRPKVTLLAGGIGITPLRALLEDLPQQPGDTTLVYRARAEQDVIFRSEIEQLARASGATVHVVLGQRVRDRESWLPQYAGHLSDADALVRLVPDIAEHDVYICGATGWMEAAKAAALQAGVPARNVHDERFSW
ncbi:ferredoxin reductase family protein [Angustibacter sp. McL0619]|uniref:ferredoxin reductase family protein n=1 Tax=Angustibacter sp. McL0619 TaxID=3415676 RepID=UPI003CF2C5AC